MSTETHGLAGDEADAADAADAVRSELRLRALDDAAIQQRTAPGVLETWLRQREIPAARFPELLRVYDDAYTDDRLWRAWAGEST